MRAHPFVAVAGAFALLWCLVHLLHTESYLRHRIAEDGRGESVGILVVGDWGAAIPPWEPDTVDSRKMFHAQQQVAAAMEVWAGEHTRFVLSTGGKQQALTDVR